MFGCFLCLIWACSEDATREEEKLKAIIVTKLPPPDKITWKKDGTEMMLIPASSFEMGDHLDQKASSEPTHPVELNDFYIDIHEVTVAAFRHFVENSD